MITNTERLVGRPTSGIVRASDPFKRFKPEVNQPVRQADITGTELDRLRARRDLLRSLDPNKAKTLIEVIQPMSFFQAVALAKREGKLIVPNYVYDRILTETQDTFRHLMWTGTLVICKAPGKKFGKKVISRFENKHEYKGATHIITKYGDDDKQCSISFAVPEKFQGKANCALVVEHPDFELLQLGNNKYGMVVPDERKVHLLEGIARSGWHNYDERFRIPIGENVEDTKDTTVRYFWRIQNKDYICILVRNTNYGGHWQYISAGRWPSDDLGLALF